MPETTLPTLGPGVQFTAPPAQAMPGIMATIDKAIATLPPGANGMAIGLVDEHGGNAAVVARVGRGWDVTLWIGKRWDSPGESYGGVVRKVW